MNTTSLTPKEQAIFLALGQAFFTAAETLGFTRKQAATFLKKERNIGEDLAGIIAGEHHISRFSPLGWMARRGPTPTVRIRGLGQLKRCFSEYKGRWYASPAGVPNLLVDIATTDPSTEVRLAAVAVLPSVYQRRFRRIIFYRNRVRRDQPEVVVKAATRRLQEGKHQEGLKHVALIASSRLAIPVLEDLDEEVLAEVACRSRDRQTAEAAANLVENHELLEKILHQSKWASAKTVVRRKLHPEGRRSMRLLARR